MTDIKENIIGKLKALPIKVKAAAIYGSWAKGAQKKDSDLDILLISDEINPRRHKRGRKIAAIKEWLLLDFPLDILLLTTKECLSNFKNHNPLFLDIAWEGIILLDEDDFLKSLIEETRVYISERGIKKLDDGWKFPVLDRKAVLLSKVSNEDFAIAMLIDGERDFKIGTSIMNNGYYDKAVYHFQQSVEKAVKAVLICFGIFKKTHFVGEILNKELGERKLNKDWREKLMQIARVSSEVEPEVTWSRYPGMDEGTLWIPYKEYTVDDANEVKEKCGKAIRAAREFIEWWFGDK
ncbi:MAG: HEPN domain-containing protein [Thermodesulfovibrionales bacterium]|nr:HEPN domain-containing protein [Thermodesulfovibrionales bacterium]